MEPLSILGAVAACAELTTLIVRVTSNLATLKVRWSEGARSLQLLIAKLSTIRAALAQVKDWAEFNATTSPNGEEMRDSLAVAMEGCHVIIEALDQDVAGLLGDSVVSRLKQLFIESTIKDHEGRLDSQITALQLLLNAAYWYVLLLFAEDPGERGSWVTGCRVSWWGVPPPQRLHLGGQRALGRLGHLRPQLTATLPQPKSFGAKQLFATDSHTRSIPADPRRYEYRERTVNSSRHRTIVDCPVRTRRPAGKQTTRSHRQLPRQHCINRLQCCSPGYKSR